MRCAVPAGAGNEPVALRVMDVTGVTVYTKALGTQQNGTVTIPMARLSAGVYLVELSCGAYKKIQRLIKE